MRTGDVIHWFSDVIVATIRLSGLCLLLTGRKENVVAFIMVLSPSPDLLVYLRLKVVVKRQCVDTLVRSYLFQLLSTQLWAWRGCPTWPGMHFLFRTPFTFLELHLDKPLVLRERGIVLSLLLVVDPLSNILTERQDGFELHDVPAVDLFFRVAQLWSTLQSVS